MAFEAIPGVKITSHTSDYSFIIGDFFAVYTRGDDVPHIYRWAEIKSITENKTEFIINTAEITYRIPKESINDERKLLNLRGLFESAVSSNPQIEYNHLKRILPPKNLYRSGNMSDALYKSNGIYKDREINMSNVVLLNTRLGKVFKIVTLVSIVIIFVILHFSWGNTEKNWFYFLPISIFSGGISAMFVYLICAIIANYHFSMLYKIDPAVNEEITFALSPDGFCAVESFLYAGNEFISWEEAAYFIETNHVFIVYKNNKAVFWLPKRLFEKDDQIEISKFIASRLYQK